MHLLKRIIPLALLIIATFMGCDELHSNPEPLPPHLWTADVGTKRLYCYDLDGTLIGSIPSPSDNPSGICFDGEALWVSDANDGRIWRVDWTDGRVIDSIPAPGQVCGGMAYDGYFLWVADATNNRVCQITPEDGHIVYEMNSPGSDPEGLAYDGILVYVSCDDNVVYQVYPAGSGQVIGYMTMPFARCTGLAYAHRALWALDADNKLLYKFNTQNPSQHSSIALPDEVYPNGLDFADPIYGPGYSPTN
jgi:DNA-binding beta-propeller fold protein YncE